MNHDPVYMRLCELSWRRKLTAAEAVELRAYLAAHPEAQADWATEAALGEELARLVDAPVPSNFTARVMHVVEREKEIHKRKPHVWWSWRVLVPRAAMAVAVVGLGLLAHQRYEIAQRVKLARSIAAVLSAQPPSPQDLADFDPIRLLPKTPPADEELLALLVVK